MTTNSIEAEAAAMVATHAAYESDRDPPSSPAHESDILQGRFVERLIIARANIDQYTH